MTLPLQLGTRILGTLNVESQERVGFSEADLSEALLLGRYIAARFTSSSWCSASVRRSIVKRPVPSVRLGPPDGEIRVALGRPTPRSKPLRPRSVRPWKQPHWAQSDLGHRAGPATRRTGSPLQGRHILVADNEAVVVQGLTKLLKANGVTVTACDGAEAISAFAECHAKGQCSRSGDHRYPNAGPERLRSLQRRAGS